jgi:hypothetical protein
MPKEKREFVGGPWDGREEEVDVVSVLAVSLEDDAGKKRIVKYYLGVDGRYHFDYSSTDRI